MKKHLIVSLLLLASVAFGQRPKTKVTYRQLSTFLVDLNNDHILDTIIISSSLPQNNGFNKIVIKLSDGSKRSFIAKSNWTTMDKWFLDSNKNIVKSSRIFIKKTVKHAVILISGDTDGAGYRGEFSIINIENNNIKMVFDDNGDIDVELPTKLIDLNNDGRLDFIFHGLHEYYEQEKNSTIGTYAPYFVYPIGDSCKLSKPLMKKYNEEHYVFAGYQYNDDIRIRYPNNGGKPTVLKKTKDER